MLLSLNKSISFAQFHKKFLEMSDYGTFKFTFGETHITRQSQELSNHGRFDKHCGGINISFSKSFHLTFDNLFVAGLQQTIVIL